jgi:hypothetical protein
MAFAPQNRARLQASLACGGALALLWWLGGRGPVIAVGITGPLALLAWLSPGRYAPVQRGLDLLVHGLLTMLTWFLLGVVYLGVFTPLRGWRALTNQDPLQRRSDPAPTTYLRPLPPATPGRFDRQF